MLKFSLAKLSRYTVCKVCNFHLNMKYNICKDLCCVTNNSHAGDNIKREDVYDETVATKTRKVMEEQA